MSFLTYYVRKLKISSSALGCTIEVMPSGPRLEGLCDGAREGFEPEVLGARIAALPTIADLLG